MRNKISEFVDGELDGEEAAAMLAALREEGEPRETWRTYHLISDALHETQLLSADFGARVSARLAQEPTVLAGSPPAAAPRTPWLLLRAAAGLAAVALVGWLAFGPVLTEQAPAPLAKLPPTAPLARVEPVRVPPPLATDDYLLAHQRYSPRSSLQGVAPYVRTVSGEAMARKP